MFRISLTMEDFANLTCGRVIEKTKLTYRSKTVVKISLQDIGFDTMLMGVLFAAKQQGLTGLEVGRGARRLIDKLDESDWT